MNTIIKNWQIVSIFDGSIFIGRVLWGIVVDDMSCRFVANDYVCTSKITSVNFDTKIVITHSGSMYQIIEAGIESTIDLKDFELLRNGLSPQQINAFGINSSKLHH